MWNKNVVTMAGLCFLSAQPALAFDLIGADFAGGYSAYFDQVEGETLSRASGEFSAEVGLAGSFGVQLDFAIQKFEQISDDIEDNTMSSTLHGLFYLDDAITLGAFYGWETMENAEYYGVEAAYYGTDFYAEAYLGAGVLNEFDVNNKIYGVNGAYQLTSDFDLIGSYSKATFDGLVDLSLVEAGFGYNYSDRIQISAALGRSNLELEGAAANIDDYFALEAEYSFGAARGATFGERGILHLIPGL